MQDFYPEELNGSPQFCSHPTLRFQNWSFPPQYSFEKPPKKQFENCQEASLSQNIYSPLFPISCTILRERSVCLKFSFVVASPNIGKFKKTKSFYQQHLGPLSFSKNQTYQI